MARLILEYPFKDVWKTGYLRTSKDDRKRVDLYNTETDRTTISYARYLLSVKLGRILSVDEEADHKNADKTDDSVSNLQVLSKCDHYEKTAQERLGRTFVELICTNCGIYFNREIRQIKKNSKPFCSRNCNGKYSRKLQMSK